MNDFQSIATAAIIGLIAGIGHGVISHKVDLPISLIDQFVEPLKVSRVTQD